MDEWTGSDGRVDVAAIMGRIREKIRGRRDRGLYTDEEVEDYIERIDEVLRVHSIGRKPRFYLLTRQGRKYTEKREGKIQDEAAKGGRKKPKKGASGVVD